MFQTLVEAVLSHGETISDKPSIIQNNTMLTYGALSALVKKTAKILNDEYGVSPGDRVMLCGVSKPEYMVVFLGIQFLHAVTVPYDKTLLEENVYRIYECQKMTSTL